MTPIVVDTDVISFIFKNESRARLYLPLLRDRKLLVSFMTEAELERWILLARWGADRIQRFRDLIVKWAEVMVAARSSGRRIDAPDAWIAATACCIRRTTPGHPISPSSIAHDLGRLPQA